MAQEDFIIGNVLNVLDGETFELEVTRVGRRNSHRYKGEEKIRINTLKPAEFVTLMGAHPRPILDRILRKKEVMCLVHSRSTGGHIEADVYII
ncbi:MAG: hypothetical protein GTO08_00055 [Deltaproteobacteria bacterium]|nr:hypothetical protein [Deltaproteobacteria bacterium]